jgi:hypothetical protein
LLVLLLLGLSPVARAQETATKQLIISLPDGGFVSFRNQTAWTDIRQALDLRQLPAALAAQALADNQTIHRVLRDNEGKFVFGYDLWVSGDPNTKQFRIAVRPLDPEMQNALRLKDQTVLAEVSSTFPQSTEPQTLSDGAEFSLDLLINKGTGVKIIDVVKVAFERTRLGDDSPAPRPRDFTLDAVALEMKDYSLLINDNLITTGESKTGCAGTLLWIYIPNRGRFIFSLFPREGYSFQKAGTVAGNKIEFTLDGDRYQWLSSALILHEEGTWNLWVLRDLHYSPLFAARQPPPTEKSVLGKLDTVINDTMKQSASAMTRKPGALTIGANSKRVEKRSVRSRDVVMMGSADRIENLLPRN